MTACDTLVPPELLQPILFISTSRASYSVILIRYMLPSNTLILTTHDRFGLYI